MDTHRDKRREYMSQGEMSNRSRPSGTLADDVLDEWIARGYGPGILERWKELESRILRRGTPSA